jgi:hypothetical protein
MPHCASCARGEVENDDVVVNAIVKDPDSGRIVIRGYLCNDHNEMYLEDGYRVTYLPLTTS